VGTGLMVGAGRFELPTPSPPDWCANQAALRSDGAPVLHGSWRLVNGTAAADRGRSYRIELVWLSAEGECAAGRLIAMLSGATIAGLGLLDGWGAEQGAAASLKLGDGPAQGIDNIGVESEFGLVGLGD
jgi:hypothetical protein